MTAEERRGPFPTYRWARQPGNRPAGHPRANGPHYGVVVEASEVLYAAPMMTGLGETPRSDDPPLFRLNMDMWAMYKSLCHANVSAPFSSGHAVFLFS